MPPGQRALTAVAPWLNQPERLPKTLDTICPVRSSTQAGVSGGRRASIKVMRQKFTSQRECYIGLGGAQGGEESVVVTYTSPIHP